LPSQEQLLEQVQVIQILLRQTHWLNCFRMDLRVLQGSRSLKSMGIGYQDQPLSVQEMASRLRHHRHHRHHHHLHHRHLSCFCQRGTMLLMALQLQVEWELRQSHLRWGTQTRWRTGILLGRGPRLEQEPDCRRR
jgi:hypothetical protein